MRVVHFVCSGVLDLTDSLLDAADAMVLDLLRGRTPAVDLGVVVVVGVAIADLGAGVCGLEPDVDPAAGAALVDPGSVPVFGLVLCSRLVAVVDPRAGDALADPGLVPDVGLVLCAGLVAGVGLGAGATLADPGLVPVVGLVF